MALSHDPSVDAPRKGAVLGMRQGRHINGHEGRAGSLDAHHPDVHHEP
jgi:hypothetical protein